MPDHLGLEKLRYLRGNTGGSWGWRALSYFKGARVGSAEVPQGDSGIGSAGTTPKCLKRAVHMYEWETLRYLRGKSVGFG